MRRTKRATSLLTNSIAAQPSVPSSPSPAPRPTNPPGVLLSDTFENPEIGQLPRVSARPSDYTFAYEGGEYVIHKINEKLPAAPIVFLPGSYDNSIIAVDVRIVGEVASRYAFVVCRDQSSGGQAKQYRASNSATSGSWLTIASSGCTVATRPSRTHTSRGIVRGLSTAR